jgi:hypothetical protein
MPAIAPAASRSPTIVSLDIRRLLLLEPLEKLGP